jgi:hypothetical protein
MPHLLYKAGATMTAHASLARRCGRLNARVDQENMFLLPMSKRICAAMTAAPTNQGRRRRHTTGVATMSVIDVNAYIAAAGRTAPTSPTTKIIVLTRLAVEDFMLSQSVAGGSA